MADKDHADVDLRDYEEEILDTINEVVPGKHPAVYEDCFITDELTQSEKVRLGRELFKIKGLRDCGMEVTQFRLFVGHTKEVDVPVKSEGGHY